ncbi:FtsW/RodA/SpoVE family cell cycle protein [Actinomadura harenae]|uniref:FtsW/RodA/SpoVE family cell cycle protein n=1 Tax=Actinomadura harenae TaxID=2483351 RepID=A0A3M2LVI7_9ACTN|nr:FtsW/RodA/SpoVE family cell cycle protein [Actinomadura harenae]RMI41106.1 FtsW/RodA/SpoVE family cell cycle protein [Actinomadura harenae]
MSAPDSVPPYRFPGPRRAASLALTAFALVVTVSAFAQVGLVRDGRLPASLFGYGAAIVVLSAVAYGVVWRWAPHADPLLVPCALLLNGVGLAIIYRIDQTTAGDYLQSKLQFEHDHPGKHYVPFGAGADVAGQLMWTALSLGLFAVFVLVLRDPRTLRRYHYTLGLAGLLFLVLPIVPGIGANINGARVWIRLGPFSVQPAEFSKLALITLFAGYLAKNGQAMAVTGRKVGPVALPRARHLMPIVVIWLVSIGVLLIQNDFGFQLLFFGLLVCMLYLGTGRGGYVVIGVLLFAVGSLSIYYLGVAVHGPLEHLVQRVEIWKDPSPYFNGGCQLKSGQILKEFGVTHPHPIADCTAMGGQYSDSSQLEQGLFAMGQGGVLGTGLGQGRPYMTPLAFSDEIFTSFGEELGLTGAMAILTVYLLLVQRGFRIAVASKDAFNRLLAGGVAFVFALQLFVIVGGVTGLIPFAGITTPFMTQGGSSLMANWILIAVLVRLSDSVRRPPPQAIQDEGMTQIVSLRRPDGR